MPKTSSSSGKDTLTTTIRLPASDIGWLGQQAEADRRSVNDLIRQWVVGYRTFYGLPDNIRKVLEEDAKELGKDIRSYIIHLRGLRYEEVRMRQKARR